MSCEMVWRVKNVGRTEMKCHSFWLLRRFIHKLLVDWVELRRAFWLSCQRQGCLHRRPWPWLKKEGCISEEDTEATYFHQCVWMPLVSFTRQISAWLFFFLIENPFEMQKIEEGRGFESDLWKIHSVRSVSTCKLFWYNSQQTIVVNNFL